MTLQEAAKKIIVAAKAGHDEYGQVVIIRNSDFDAFTRAYYATQFPERQRPHRFTPTDGNVYRCSECGQPSYDCTGEPKGLIRRNPQATAEEDQL